MVDQEFTDLKRLAQEPKPEVVLRFYESNEPGVNKKI